MRGNWLRLDEDRILAEHLCLLLHKLLRPAKLRALPQNLMRGVEIDTNG